MVKIECHDDPGNRFPWRVVADAGVPDVFSTYPDLQAAVSAALVQAERDGGLRVEIDLAGSLFDWPHS
jgi:hypothetical protein